MTYEIYPSSLYDYTAGTLCGVLVKEDVMRKLAKLQTAHLEAVKRLLIDEADRGKVFSSMWTLHHPGGVQTEVKFIDTSTDVYSRIHNAVSAHQPRHHPLVFVAGCMDDAKRMADEHYKEMHLHKGEK